MSRRPLRALVSASCASGDRTRAEAGRGPRSTGRCRPWRRSRDRPALLRAVEIGWAIVASASATRTCAASELAVCDLDRAIDRGEHLARRPRCPGSTSTRVTRPPSPATPTGISRRAASAAGAADHGLDRLAAGNRDRDGRDLRIVLGSRGGRLLGRPPVPIAHHEEGSNSDNRHHGQSDPQPTPRLRRVVTRVFQPILSSEHPCLVIRVRDPIRPK
jgi:hypothetical protein